jgi:hypothetical protein
MNDTHRARQWAAPRRVGSKSSSSVVRGDYKIEPTDRGPFSPNSRAEWKKAPCHVRNMFTGLEQADSMNPAVDRDRPLKTGRRAERIDRGADPLPTSRRNGTAYRKKIRLQRLSLAGRIYEVTRQVADEETRGPSTKRWAPRSMLPNGDASRQPLQLPCNEYASHHFDGRENGRLPWRNTITRSI